VEIWHWRRGIEIRQAAKRSVLATVERTTDSLRERRLQPLLQFLDNAPHVGAGETAVSTEAKMMTSVSGFRFKVQGSRFLVHGFWFTVSGSRFLV
jgi:hypothetical protein